MRRSTLDTTVFKLDIKNSLGLDAMQARSTLKLHALSKPAEYAKERNVVYTAVVSHIVDKVFEDIWKVLKAGVLPDGSHIQIASAEWKPDLPDAEIADIANGFAKSIMESFTDIMDKILPDSFSAMADNKLMNSANVSVV